MPRQNSANMKQHDMTELGQIAAAAYNSERVASRRLARSSGITENEALRRTMEVAALTAGLAGLAELLAARALRRADDEERQAAKKRDKAEWLARRKAGPQAAAPHAWHAWFDGSAHPNPGKLGLGALLAGPEGQRIEISQRAGHGNSGEAEYLALIALMEAAVQLQPPELVVHGDSQVVINDVNQAQTVGAKGLEAHRARVAELMAQLSNVTLRWVPRHKNGEADRLSQQAIASWPPD